MRTLLVGLDNHRKAPPHRALWPIPEKETGAVLMRLIDEHVDEEYRPGAFVLDFARTNLYPMRRAPNGRGMTAQDSDAIAHLIYTAGMIGVNDIVLIGSRVVRAFNQAMGENLTWLESCVIETNTDELRRFWAVPYPDKRFVQFRKHRDDMGKLLAMLRNRTMIPYGKHILKKHEQNA